MGIAEFLLARIAEDEHDALPFRNDFGRAKKWRCSEIGGEIHEVGERSFGLSSLLGTFDTHMIAKHASNWHPARVLAECKAKRAVINEHHPHDHGGDYGNAAFCDVCQWDHNDDEPRIDNQPFDDSFGANPCATLRALAAVYADHPGYKDEWKLQPN